MKIFQYHIIGAGLLIGAAVIFQPHSAFSQVAQSINNPLVFKGVRGLWTTEAWTADEEPYTRIKNEILIAEAKGKSPDMMAMEYKVIALQKQSDPLPRFRWAYAAYLTGIRSKPYSTDKLRQAASGLGVFTPSPQSYEFTRLRFLTESFLGEPLNYPDLIIVGKRLARRNPKDMEVRVQLCQILSVGPTLADRQNAVTHAKELLSIKPKDFYYIGNLATVYNHLWSRTRKRSDRLAAIVAYRHYVRLAPSSVYRKNAEYLLKYLEGAKDGPLPKPKFKS